MPFERDPLLCPVTRPNMVVDILSGLMLIAPPMTVVVCSILISQVIGLPDRTMLTSEMANRLNGIEATLRLLVTAGEAGTAIEVALLPIAASLGLRKRKR